VELLFAGTVIEWRGPSPYYFVPVPDEESADIREVAAMATYGWGVIPVVARIGETDFETSLFPKDGGYLLPLKDAVRKPQGITAGQDVTVEFDGASLEHGQHPRAFEWCHLAAVLVPLGSLVAQEEVEDVFTETLRDELTLLHDGHRLVQTAR
jgi:hypothetical protein